MARASNVIITVLNIITIFAALIAVGSSIWFESQKSSSSLCQKGLQKPLLFLGLALFMVSLLGLLGSCCSSSKRLISTVFMWLYLLVLFLLIIGMIGFTVFAIIVTNRGIGRALSNKGVGDHKLGDYSKWLQKYVLNEGNWDEIKSCMVDVGFCKHRLPPAAAKNNADFFENGLPATQSACCKPPSYCGLEFQNATYWTMPKSGPAVPDSDCRTWSNDQTRLCFDCKSCKAAVLGSIKRKWTTLAMFNFIILLLVTIVYSVGCCALSNNRRGKYTSGYS